jgi:hypothetical protein
VDSTIQLLTVLIILASLVLTVILTQFVRRRRDRYVLRDFPAFNAIPRMIGESIEMNRPLHVAFGNNPLDTQLIPALVSAELGYQVLRRTVIGSSKPIVTAGSASAVPIAHDTLRRAYASRGLIRQYRATSTQWYPAGERGFGYAAAVSGVVADNQVSANVLSGNYSTEMALVGDAMARRGQSVIATSTNLQGQAVAYVFSDYPLIGEEVFAAASYLEGTASQMGGTVTQATLRGILIFILLVVTVAGLADYFTNNAFTESLSRLVGGILGGGG